MPTAKPVFANVAFLRIPAFDARPVGEQAALKDALERRVREAIASVDAADRVVLDAEDGLALVLFGEPGRALEAARALQASREVPLQVGLNHGPLALAGEGAGERVFGDGLTSAAAAARFAQPERLLVTQEFARALERRDPALAVQLENAGDFTDTRVRQRSFYTPQAKLASVYRRRMLAIGVLGVVAILSLGWAAREASKRLFPPPPAIVKLNVKPRGEVYVDGNFSGRIPPLRELQLPAGVHAIEIRNPGFKPYQATLEVHSGEQASITHTFTRPPPAREAPQPGFWDNLRRKFGGGG
ncbi:MAG TPA: PEGA domain-containing protein [Usitatibacter sp.]|nr:PEGA domain-containing protein [Usitatibacter sp.]